MSELERRAYEIIDLRADDGDSERKVSGLGIPYGRDSLPIFGMFKEQIAQGAFARSLASRDIKMFAHHDSSRVLAATGNGSMVLTDSPRGISFDSKLADTVEGRDMFTNIATRLIKGMSFQFRAIKERFIQAEGEELPTRIVEEGDLFELSPVTFPAYPDSDVAQAAKRAFEEWQTGINNVMNEAEIEAEWRARELKLRG